jgi:predicted metalloprotease with PDZ domain
VYEGLTRYLNWVLAARAGILTDEEARDYAALLAAQTAYRSGREWRSLQDTAISTSMLNEAPDQWQSLRRGVDYYDESLFIWLEADTIIRRNTAGKRSLDDFCRAFLGPPRNPPERWPYNFDDLVSVLQGVAPFDWKVFFETRLNATGVDNAPLDGLGASGWKLSYGKTQGSVEAARDGVHKTLEERFSLGLLLDEDGDIVDVVRDSPAWKAGMGPGMKVLAVDHQKWSPHALRDAVANNSSSAPLALSLQNGLEKLDVNFRERIEARHPYLERSTGQDLMGEILKPTSSRLSQPETR